MIGKLGALFSTVAVPDRGSIDYVDAFSRWLSVGQARPSNEVTSSYGRAGLVTSAESHLKLRDTIRLLPEPSGATCTKRLKYPLAPAARIEIPIRKR